jgi:putative transposase
LPPVDCCRGTSPSQAASSRPRLNESQRNWGFGLSFLYLRNVKGFGWNHKRVYRIYCELELNLRIKPKKRLLREAPAPLTIPAAKNEVWSMDFSMVRSPYATVLV